MEKITDSPHWQAVHTQGWTITKPDTQHSYSITIFDDGNEKYEKYINVWHAYGTWRGKVALVNHSAPSVRIPSISKWKTCKLRSESSEFLIDKKDKLDDRLES